METVLFLNTFFYQKLKRLFENSSEKKEQKMVETSVKCWMPKGCYIV